MPQPIVNVEPATAHELQAAGEVVLLDVPVVTFDGTPGDVK